MNRLKIFPRAVMLIGAAFVIAGVVATVAGLYINSFVVQQLAAQNITTPENASIPNAHVRDIPTALSMANRIQQNAAEMSGGLTFAQMGRFAVPDGNIVGTNNPEEALLDANGRPVINPARTVQLNAASLITSLSLSAMAIGLSYGAIALGIGFVVLGLVVAGMGYALLGLVTPEVAERFGLKPVTAAA